MKKISTLFIALIAAVMLSGCSSEKPVQIDEVKPEDVVEPTVRAIEPVKPEIEEGTGDATEAETSDATEAEKISD